MRARIPVTVVFTFVMVAGGLLMGGPARADTTVFVGAGPGLGLAIPDGAYNGTLGSMASSSAVSSDAGAITGIDVLIAFDHTWIGDLVFKLRAPSGTIVTLMARPGKAGGAAGAGDSSNANKSSAITFTAAGSDDVETAGSTIGDSQAICADDGRCSYLPNADGDGSGSLSAFIGQSVNGSWTLFAGDGAAGDVGVIDKWTLTVQISASQQSQTITFDPIADHTYGDAPFDVNATASSGLPVTLASTTPGVCAVSGSTVTIQTAGGCSITASQAGDEQYEPAPDVSRSFTVSKAPLTITSQDVSRVYGAHQTVLVVTYSGFVLGETFGTSDVEGAPACSTTAKAASPVGTYSITCSTGTLSSANYSFTFVGGSLSVTPKALRVRADAHRTYGADDPPFLVTYRGFALHQTYESSDLTGSPSCTTGATSSSPVGTYPITCSAGTLGSTNYTFVFLDGTMRVTKALLTVTPDDVSRAHGQPNPPFTVSYSGFVLGETLPTSGVTGNPKCTTTAHRSSPPGTYPIVCSRGTLSSGNYRFTFVAGTLTVT